MEHVKRFNQEFIVRTGEDETCLIWDGPVDKCPSQLITFAATDGDDGLMWETWEEFWVDYAIHPENLNAKQLLKHLTGYIAANEKKYHRTVITVEVLSEDPYDPEILADVANDICEGSCSGKWEVSETEEVNAKRMTELLEAQGSDPAFLDIHGECKKCGSSLDSEGYCTDETCPHYDHLQNQEFTEE